MTPLEVGLSICCALLFLSLLLLHNGFSRQRRYCQQLLSTYLDLLSKIRKC